MPAVQRASNAPSIDTSMASASSSDARQAPRTRPKSMHHHQPYRIELLDVTPVSVSLLWSTRPPPLSAIPLEIMNTQLRKRIKSKGSAGASGSPSRSHSMAKATAVSPGPSTAIANLSKSRGGFKPASNSPERSISQSKSTATSAHPETHVTKLTEGLVATRSRNRKVTKIRLKAPSSTAPQSKPATNGLAASVTAHGSHDDDNWPSDDGATAVEDEPGTGSEASDSGYEGDLRPYNNLVNVFEDRVSISVNGNDWPHVLLGERGSHEAIVVIFALEPESDYDIRFTVRAGMEVYQTETFKASLRTRGDRELSRSGDASAAAVKAQGSTTNRSVSPSPLGRMPVSTPQVAVLPTETQPQRKAVLQAELESSEALKASLLAEIKKARKEASKAEAVLKHEIDAIKRGMDRMSATDHRNRQKVLALQELIKQTTVHVQDIHQEAEQAEQSQPEWKAKVAEVDVDLEKLRAEVEADEESAQSSWDQDEAAVAALEKDYKALENAVKGLESERDELQQQKLAPLDSELERVKRETKETLNRPYPVISRGTVPLPRGGPQRHVSNPSQSIPPSSLQKGKGSQNGGRGGRTGYFGNRAVSGPAAAPFSGPVAQPAGFPGPSRPGFMQNLGRGIRDGFHRNHMDPMVAGYSGPDMLNQTGSPSPGGAMVGAMQDSALGGMQTYGGRYPANDNFYGMPYQQESEATNFPSGVSEVSQDDLYDPTLGFDPYDPLPDTRRRSSLPVSQLPKVQQSTALNPANPEFVPSAGSNHTSPVISKGDIGPSTTNVAASTTFPSIAAVSNQSPPHGTSSLEHSPTSSSRFAFPLARHQPSLTASSSAGRSSVGPAPGPNNVLSPTLGNDLGLPSASASSPNLYPIGTGGAVSPFARHSPLLSQGPNANATTSPLVFSSSSPRFGPAQLRSTDDHAGNSNGSYAKFGPLDFEPSMEGFGPAPGVIGGTTGAGLSSSVSPYGSAALPSIFSSSDAWSAPSAPANTSLGSGSSLGSGPVSSTSAWSAPSPPLGTSVSGGDIWSASGLGGASQLRSSLPLNETASSPLSGSGFGNLNLSLDNGYGGYGNTRAGSRAIGRSSSGSSSSHHLHVGGPSVSSPVSASSTLKSPPISAAAVRVIPAEAETHGSSKARNDHVTHSGTVDEA